MPTRRKLTELDGSLSGPTLAFRSTDIELRTRDSIRRTSVTSAAVGHLRIYLGPIGSRSRPYARVFRSTQLDTITDVLVPNRFRLVVTPTFRRFDRRLRLPGLGARRFFVTLTRLLSSPLDHSTDEMFEQITLFGRKLGGELLENL
jgi:hypothetical protein